MRRLLAAALTLATAALLTLTATPAHAHHTDRTDLVLTWYALHGPDRAAATLHCAPPPPSGTHPRPARACRALDRAGGDPAHLRPEWGPCTLEYAPVRAVIVGTWEGTPVWWTKTYSNRCFMERATGGVMRLG